MSMLDALDDSSLKTKRERKTKEKPNKEPKPKTWEVSLRLYRQGFLPDAIAHERSLTLATIRGHLLRYLPTGEVQLDDILPPERRQAIRQAIEAAGPDAPLYIIRDHCPLSDVSYDEIRLLLELMKGGAG
jgi:uncharacterized protein YpbB